MLVAMEIPLNCFHLSSEVLGNLFFRSSMLSDLFLMHCLLSFQANLMAKGSVARMNRRIDLHALVGI